MKAPFGLRGLPIALATAAVFGCFPANAEVDALVKNALSLIQTGQSKQAFDLLEPQESARAGDPDFDTTLGIAANEIGANTRAVFALERALSVQPGNARARAELARALFAVGDTQGSRTLLEQTKTQGVPPEVAKTIDQFIQAIDKAEESSQSSFKGYVEVGGGHDSNINSGPADSNVAVPVFGGAVFTLTPGGVKTNASFYSLGAGVAGRYTLAPRWSAIGNVGVSLRNNSGSTTSDTQQLDAGAGVSYRQDRNELSLIVQGGSTDVDHSRLRTNTGIVAEWTYHKDAFQQWNSYVQRARLHYPTQNVRDADRTILGSSYALFMRGNTILWGSLYAGSENERAAGVAHLGHRLWGFRAGVKKQLSENLAFFSSLGYEDRKFGGQDPLFLVTRSDQQTNFNFGLNWTPAKKWTVTPQISLLQNTSNIVINDFSKQVVSVTARREF